MMIFRSSVIKILNKTVKKMVRGQLVILTLSIAVILGVSIVVTTYLHREAELNRAQINPEHKVKYIEVISKSPNKSQLIIDSSKDNSNTN